MRFYHIQLVALAMVATLCWGSHNLTHCVAEDKAESLQPIPESTSLQQVCPHCEQQIGSSPYGYYSGSDATRRKHMGPGAGWCAPTKVIQQRQRVQYWKWYPNYWSGHGPGPAMPYQPMVYTPTDTTQLGFYYQHVPHWTAQPWRTPGPAHPGLWHNRYCGQCRQGYGNGNCYQGGGYSGYGYHPQMMPLDSEQTPTMKSDEDSTPAEAEQTIILPQPSFVPNAPTISVLPDAPPEV